MWVKLGCRVPILTRAGGAGSAFYLRGEAREVPQTAGVLPISQASWRPCDAAPGAPFRGRLFVRGQTAVLVARRVEATERTGESARSEREMWGDMYFTA